MRVHLSLVLAATLCLTLSACKTQQADPISDTTSPTQNNDNTDTSKATNTKDSTAQPEEKNNTEEFTEVMTQKVCIANPWKDSRRRTMQYVEETKYETDEELKDAVTMAQDELARGVDYPPEDVMQRIGDLDGDGEKDKLYMWNPWMSNYAALFFLYLSNKGCEHFAGMFITGPDFAYVEVLEEREEDLPLLLTFSKGGCAGTEGTLYWHKWSKDETIYKEDRTEQCECMDDPSAKAKKRHPKCP